MTRVERDVEAGLSVHVILDNYATHKTPDVEQWLRRHPRVHFHFTPTSASWLNLVELLFVWTASVRSILAKVRKAKDTLASHR